LAQVRNVAAAAFLAATRPETAGRAVNVLDSEVTSVEEFYRLLAGIFLPEKAFRSVVLPVWLGLPVALAVTALSNALDLAHPLADPSLYALATVSSNLDFSNRRFLDLMARAGRQPVTRAEGLAELAASVVPAGWGPTT
jgi:nucleoside-diphosphate-sugar epimerase